jgi:hypothetical protein
MGDEARLPEVAFEGRGGNFRRTSQRIQRRVTLLFEFRLPSPPWMAYTLGKNKTSTMRNTFIFLATVATLAAEPALKPIQTVSELIQELPPQRVLREAKQLLRRESSVVPESSVTTPQDLERARENVRKAKSVIPNLRKHILEGTSVFDYSGLLSRGSISWNEYSKVYTMYLGVGTVGDEGTEPFAMLVIFNTQGKISAVRDVIVKH